MFCFTVCLIFSFRVVIRMDFIKFICGSKESFLPRGNGQVKVTELSQLFNVRGTCMHIKCKDNTGIFQVLWPVDGRFILPIVNEFIVIAVENQQNTSTSTISFGPLTSSNHISFNASIVGNPYMSISSRRGNAACNTDIPLGSRPVPNFKNHNKRHDISTSSIPAPLKKK